VIEFLENFNPVIQALFGTIFTWGGFWLTVVAVTEEELYEDL
jgi:hypothetical protein